MLYSVSSVEFRRLRTMTSLSVPRLIYIHVAITALLFCAVWVYFPSYPRVPPSASAPHPLHRNSAEKRKTPGGSLDASTTDTEQVFIRSMSVVLGFQMSECELDDCS